MDILPNSSTSINDTEYKELFELTQQITGLYLLPFISIFGIFGNVCNVIVYTKSKKYSTNVYLIALALSDIVKLINDFIYFLVNLIKKIDSNSNLADKLFNSLYLYSHYIFVLTAINTAWLTCTIAIDRYVTVSSKNAKRTSEFNYFKSILISILITFFSCLFAVPSPLFLRKVDQLDPETNTTISMVASSELVQMNIRKFYNYFNAMVRAFIPLVLIIYLNYKIIRLIYKNKMKKRLNKKKLLDISRMNTNPSLAASLANAGQTKKSKSKVTLMLLVIILTFVMCIFPDAILTMMHLGYANENYLVRSIREVTDLLLAVNSASTFAICYHFSIQYREKFRQVFFFSRQKSSDDLLQRQVSNDYEETFVKTRSRRTGKTSLINSSAKKPKFDL